MLLPFCLTLSSWQDSEMSDVVTINQKEKLISERQMVGIHVGPTWE